MKIVYVRPEFVCQNKATGAKIIIIIIIIIIILIIIIIITTIIIIIKAMAVTVMIFVIA